MGQKLTKIELKVGGMHCASCAVAIERRLLQIAWVEKAKVSFNSGKAEVWCARSPQLQVLRDHLKKGGYTLTPWGEQTKTQRLLHAEDRPSYPELGTILLVLLALYSVLKQFHLLPDLGVTDNMSVGFVFLIGLVASVSTCIAVTGGLLLAVAAKYNETYPDLTGRQKLKPHLYFNAGRIVSYTVLGGGIGALGSVFSLSPRANGVLTLLASLVMILLGLQLLHLFPGLRRFQPRMPKILAHRIHDLAGRDSRSAPFLLGALTFFLPCGFTQALQLYVLSRGDALTGALTMLVFALGTLPAFLSLSALSSFAKGAFQRQFIKVAGVLVVLVGLFNIDNGLALAGSSITLRSMLAGGGDIAAQAATMVNGRQIVRMKVVGLDYYPHRFIVQQGIPVEWRIDGRQADGCARIIVIPQMNKTQYLATDGLTTIRFTPRTSGTIDFSCPMGMTTSDAAFMVSSNSGATGSATVASASDDQPEFPPGTPVQRLTMEVSDTLGFYPAAFTVKKGIPVELTINDRVPLSGCMSVLTIPKYSVAISLKRGANRLVFTPTEAGEVPITCSMGTEVVHVTVTR